MFSLCAPPQSIGIGERRKSFSVRFRHALLLVTREAMAKCAQTGKTIFCRTLCRFARISPSTVAASEASRNGPSHDEPTETRMTAAQTPSRARAFARRRCRRSMSAASGARGSMRWPGRTADILYQRCVEAGMLDQIDPDRPSPGVQDPVPRPRRVPPRPPSRPRCSGTPTSARRSRRPPTRSIARPIPSSRRRSTRSSTCMPGCSSPTAICRAGISASSRASAGPTCAIVTNSIAPAI